MDKLNFFGTREMTKKFNFQYLDRPSNLSAESVTPTELNITFTTEMRLWRPSHYKVRFPSKF